MSQLHRPDSGYPKAGVISVSGILHLGYFFVQCSVSAYLSLLMLVGVLQGLPLYIALLGGAIYVLSFAFDVRKGAFKQLPSIV